MALSPACEASASKPPDRGKIIFLQFQNAILVAKKSPLVAFHAAEEPRSADVQRPLRPRHLRNSREGVGFGRRFPTAP